MNRALGQVYKVVAERFEYDYDLPHPMEGVFTVKGDFDFETNSVYIDSIDVQGKCIMDAFDLDWVANEYIMKEYVQ